MFEGSKSHGQPKQVLFGWHEFEVFGASNREWRDDDTGEEG